MSPFHDIAHAIRHSLLESPVAERAMEKATLGSAGVTMASGAVEWLGMTETELTLAFSAGGLFFTVLFGSIHVWIKLQHLKIARENRGKPQS